MYLTYDIKSIQRVIFGVPKLKPIIGASGMIAEFDVAASRLVEKDQLVFTGGGCGAFRFNTKDEAETLRERLRADAKVIGIDLRIGIDESYSVAKQRDVLYPFYPDELSGKPCEMSGFWPVGATNGWRL
ncbi:MAG: hypothetical protein ABI614_20475, partial [Planctomycetota bacterium]